jgi:hyperosmotically inducible periplasmic protein
MRSHLTSWTAAVAFALTTVACGNTDSGITTAVKAKLATADEVKAYEIDVDTQDKIVTLSGEVDSPMAKSRAVELARATDGVRGVTDNLTVSAAMSSTAPANDAERATFTDAGLTTSVKTKLLADPSVGGLRIDVDTRDGIVTLTGQLKTQTEKETALRIARETEGVRSVEDKLTVVP